jgi:hypothetical protein
MPSWASAASTPRSRANSSSRLQITSSSPATIPPPQWVKIARATPASLHQVSWVRTGVWPIRASPRLRTSGRAIVAALPT